MGMTDTERGLMLAHMQYLQGHFVAGRVLIYGPVMATEGYVGMAVFEVENEAEARSIAENDPQSWASCIATRSTPCGLEPLKVRKPSSAGWPAP